MARTAEAARLTQQHRAQQLALRARSIRGLIDLWRGVDPTRLSETIDTFTEAAVLLAIQGRADSGALGGRYANLFRQASGVPGVGPRFVLPRASSALLGGELRGAALKGIIDARRAGMNVERSKSNGLVRVAGTLAKLILTGGFMTVTGTVQRDPVALGWQRVGSDDPCPFCRMLISRGAAYKTQRAAEIVPHEGCACIAEPLYRGDKINAQTGEYEAEWRLAQAWARDNVTRKRATSNNALNNYRRWLAAGKPAPGRQTAA